MKAMLLDTMENAPVMGTETIISNPFRLNKKGVFFVPEDKEKPAIWLSSPLHILAHTRDENGDNHGILLGWKDGDGKSHKWAMPCELLAGNDGMEIFKRLLREGVVIAPQRQAKNKLLEYIQAVPPPKKMICLSRIGWHEGSFALPDKVFPEECGKVLQAENRNFEGFQVSGSLKEWQDNVACYAQGNSRIIFALSTAFAAPLLHIAKEESGIVHLVGNSSRGKTTLLQVSASVYGGGGENGFIKQWRATGNALEAIAEAHRDCLLLLDEMGQADGKTVGDTVYMLANNQGKGRMQSSASLRKTYEWRVLVLSSGEVTLETKMAEAGKKAMAGMQVRCVNIPAEVEGGYGAFENLHRFTDAGAFADYLKDTTSRYYGSAIREYIAHVVALKDKLPEILKAIKEAFLRDYVPKNADSQVRRVAARFALIAAAGELAIELGILPLQENDAIRASAKCFKDWLEYRGNAGSSEIENGIIQVRSYLEKYGASKCITLNEDGSENTISSRPTECIGYRKLIDGVYHFYLFPDAYKEELCKGVYSRALTAALVEREFLAKEGDKNQVLETFPGQKKRRYYHITPAIFTSGEN